MPSNTFRGQDNIVKAKTKQKVMFSFHTIVLNLIMPQEKVDFK